MKTKYIVIALLFSVLGSNLYAQLGNVLVKSSKDESSVRIKWIYDKLWNKEGVYYFRKHADSSNWVKLNKTPYKFGDYEPTTDDFAKDPELQDYIDMVDNTADKDVVELTKLTFFLKILLSDAFARYVGVEFHDNTAIKGEEYIYKVHIVRKNTETLLGMSKPIVAGRFVKENSPDDVVVKPLDKQITMKWKPDNDRFFAVNIYRQKEGDALTRKLNETPILISETSKDSSGNYIYPEVFYKDDSLENYVTYKYRLAGLDFFAEETEMTKDFVIQTSDLSPPSPPYNVKHEINDMEVDFTWEIKPSDDHAGFNVYRNEKDVFPYQKVNTIMLKAEQRKYKDIVPEPRGYYYYVSSVDTAGNENFLQKLFVDVRDIHPPETPVNLIAKADTGVVSLSWEANSEKDLMGYLVYRKIKKNKDGEFNLVTAQAIVANQFNDSLPKSAKNKFIYYVVAMDTSYNKSKPSNLASASMPDVIAPQAPVLKSAYPRGDSIFIEWMPNVEKDIIGYNIYRAESTKDVGLLLNEELIDPEKTSYIDASALPGKKYEYYLIASDSSGNKSDNSNRFSAYIVKKSTGASEIKKFLVKSRKNSKQVSINWEVEPSKELIGCKLFKGNSKELLLPYSELIKEGKYGTIDNKVEENEKYFYQLRVYHANGVVVKTEVVSVSVGVKN